MQLETYPFAKQPESYYYVFYSDGPKGKIKKVVEFFRLQDQELEIYNLAFGDWDQNTNRFNDQIASNNSDRNKVLATVAATVMEFIQTHPGSIILATGSTTSRTRLYQMGIARIWNEITPMFEIQGYVKGGGYL